MDSDFTARYLQDPEPPAAKMSAPGGDVGAPDVSQHPEIAAPGHNLHNPPAMTPADELTGAVSPEALAFLAEERAKRAATEAAQDIAAGRAAAGPPTDVVGPPVPAARQAGPEVTGEQPLAPVARTAEPGVPQAPAGRQQAPPPPAHPAPQHNGAPPPNTGPFPNAAVMQQFSQFAPNVNGAMQHQMSQFAPPTGPGQVAIPQPTRPAGLPAVQPQAAPVIYGSALEQQLADPDAPAEWTAGSVTRHLRTDHIVHQRRQPPEMGWRKGVFRSSFGLINLGAGPAERQLNDQKALIRTNIPGNYHIAMVSVGGGVGKTRLTAGLGTAYRMFRSDPVLAIDGNPTYGQLGRLIDSNASMSVRDFLTEPYLHTYPKARQYTGQNRWGLEVLAGNQNMRNPLSLLPFRDQSSGKNVNPFQETLNRANRFYQLSLIDCGPDIEHPIMSTVLSNVDALVIVAPQNFDGGEAAEKTIAWLDVRRRYELLKRSVVVLNDVYNCDNKVFVTEVERALGTRVGTVKTVPWDAHLRDAAEFDFDALARRTQLAFIDIAAWLAKSFAMAGTLPQ